jgi:uncharacterized protein YbaR (Trm112 family)
MTTFRLKNDTLFEFVMCPKCNDAIDIFYSAFENPSGDLTSRNLIVEDGYLLCWVCSSLYNHVENNMEEEE